MRTKDALHLALQILDAVETTTELQPGETETLPSLHITSGHLRVTVLVSVTDTRPKLPTGARNPHEGA